jgi:TolB protein
MKHKLSIGIVLLLVGLLAGCGGDAQHATVQRGRVSFTIHWPSRSRLIPAAANSIKVVLTDAATSNSVASQVAARPTTGSQSIITFNGLAPGSLHADLGAYPSTDGSGTAQAHASVQPVTIQSGQTTTVPVTLTSTIASIVLTPATSQLAPGASLTVTATAYDGAGSVVLTTPSLIQWTSSNTAAATVQAGVITGVGGGTAQITATDPESGKSGSATVTVAAWSGLIVFTSTQAPATTENIFTMNADGSGVTDLTNSTQIERAARFSPDGRSIIFARKDPNALHVANIWIMGIDGTHPTQIAPVQANGQSGVTGQPDNFYFTPSFSQDETHILFTCGYIQPFIAVMDANGGNAHVLTDSSGNAIGGGSPSYSPDGTTIIFQANSNGTNGPQNIIAMNADGANQRQLTNLTVAYQAAGAPRYSLDGRRIVFAVSIYNPNTYQSSNDIWIMNADGSGQTQLTHDGLSSGPAFTRSGKIVFVGTSGGRMEIYRMNADGTSVQPLTNTASTITNWWADSL